MRHYFTKLTAVQCLLLLLGWQQSVLVGSQEDTTTAAPATVVPTAAPSTSAEAWGGCVNPSNPQALVTIGDPTIVCLQIGNSTNWSAGVSYIRLSFQPTADAYSRLYIPNSYNDLVVNSAKTIWDGQDIALGVASQSSLSFLRTYRSINNTRIYPFLTAIIDVNNGVVRGITWDNACLFCNPITDGCDEITWDFGGQPQNQSTAGQTTTSCFITQEECNTNANTTACDITLYVVWTGTDARGLAFQSSASRFSAFPVQNLQDRFLSSLPTFGLTRQRQLAEVEIHSVLPDF